MKKVLILANHINWVYSLRKELIEGLSETYKVILCIPSCEESVKLQYFKNIGVDVTFVNYNRRSKNAFGDFLLMFNYYQMIKNINPDIVLTYTVKPNIYGAYVSSKLKKPVIMNITGVGSSLSDSNLKLLVLNMYKHVMKNVSKVFFQNDDNYSLFIAKKITSPSKSIILPGSGVNIKWFMPLTKTVTDGIIRFLFIGRVMQEKGIDEYLEAAEYLTKVYKNVEFQILGPFEEEKYKKVISNLSNKRIKYLGTSEDVRCEIREVDCIINPSYHEGMSNVLLESAAMAKPLIASNIPGCREVIEDGINGYLFESKSTSSLQQKIIKFINLDQKEKDEMGMKSRVKVEGEFDRDIVIGEYLNAIKNILN